MATSRLHELSEAGVSPWIDSVSREMLETGELARLMKEDADRRRHLEPDDLPEGALHGRLVRRAARRAAEDRGRPDRDLPPAGDGGHPPRLRPDAARSGSARDGVDGYVSIEVDPTLAYDREATFEQAIRLHDEVDKPNLFVKIPATVPGLAAIEDCIAKGKSINVTLIFSLERYAAVAEAYITRARAARRRRAATRRTSRPSRASSSRASTRRPTGGSTRSAARRRGLKGKLAIANAKLAYRHWQEAFAGPRWEFLAGKGATPQRCLWASTSTKNPEYRDVMYVEELIGPETVNTMPAETIVAFQDHGKVVAGHDHRGRRRGAEAARAAGRGRRRLRRRRRDARGGGRAEVRRLVPGAARRDPRQAGRARCGVTSIVERIWAYDASLWTDSGEDRWLGWLDVVPRVRAARRRAERLRGGGDRAVPRLRPARHGRLLAGAGGAAADVQRRVVPRPRHDASRRRSAGSSASVDLEQTLFLASSKSGSTIETRSHLEYFWERTGGRGAQFAAITDPGSELDGSRTSAASAPSSRASRRSAGATRRSRCSGSCRRR